MKKILSGALRIIRVRQWVKNFFVFVPLFFGGMILNASALATGVITFFAFCFIASAIYCLNDIVDVEADRRHPVKCSRPIASGDVSVTEGYLLMALMVALSAGMICLLSEHMLKVGGIVAFYFVLNVAYCVKLKDKAIVDVCIVAFGFVLRIMAGGMATDIVLSKWIVLMTFLLTLFLSFAKRRDDVLRMDATGIAPRKNTIRYNLTFINQAITITGAVMLVCYIMYTVAPDTLEHFHTDYLYLTSIPVLLGLLRYIQIAVVDMKSGDPTKVIIKDRAIQAIVLVWIMAFLFIIYVA